MAPGKSILEAEPVPEASHLHINCDAAPLPEPELPSPILSSRRTAGAGAPSLVGRNLLLLFPEEDGDGSTSSGEEEPETWTRDKPNYSIHSEPETKGQYNAETKPAPEETERSPEKNVEPKESLDEVFSPVIVCQKREKKTEPAQPDLDPNSTNVSLLTTLN